MFPHLPAAAAAAAAAANLVCVMLKYQLAVKAHLDLFMSPFLFPFPLQRPPVAGCLFAGAIALEPAAWTNLERTHGPSSSQQPESNQPNKLALLLHRGPPSIRSIRVLGHTPTRDVNCRLPWLPWLPARPAWRSAPSRLPNRAASYGLLPGYQQTISTLHEPPPPFAVIAPSFLGYGGRGKHQPSVGVPGAPRTSFNWLTHGLVRQAA